MAAFISWYVPPKFTTADHTNKTIANTKCAPNIFMMSNSGPDLHNLRLRKFGIPVLIATRGRFGMQLRAMTLTSRSKHGIFAQRVSIATGTAPLGHSVCNVVRIRAQKQMIGIAAAPICDVINGVVSVATVKHMYALRNWAAKKLPGHTVRQMPLRKSSVSRAFMDGSHPIPASIRAATFGNRRKKVTLVTANNSGSTGTEFGPTLFANHRAIMPIRYLSSTIITSDNGTAR